MYQIISHFEDKKGNTYVCKSELFQEHTEDVIQFHIKAAKTSHLVEGFGCTGHELIEI